MNTVTMSSMFAIVGNSHQNKFSKGEVSPATNVVAATQSLKGPLPTEVEAATRAW